MTMRQRPLLPPSLFDGVREVWEEEEEEEKKKDCDLKARPLGVWRRRVMGGGRSTLCHGLALWAPRVFVGATRWKSCV